MTMKEKFGGDRVGAVTLLPSNYNQIRQLPPTAETYVVNGTGRDEYRKVNIYTKITRKLVYAKMQLSP